MDIAEFFRKDRFAAAADIRIEEVRKAYARCSMKIQDKHLNAAGSTQGGAVFTLADFCLAIAANTQGKIAVSTQANIQFIKGSVAGDTLYAEARERFLHKSTGVYQVEVHNQHHELIALFQANVYRKDLIPPFEPISE